MYYIFMYFKWVKCQLYTTKQIYFSIYLLKTKRKQEKKKNVNLNKYEETNEGNAMNIMIYLYVNHLRELN